LTIILTGSSGFLGKAAFRIGAKELCLERLVLRAHDQIDAALFKNVAGCIHLGALSSPAECSKNPKEAWLSNVVLTQSLLRAAQQSGAFFIFASTDWVFDGSGSPAEDGFKESASPWGARSLYGTTKLEGERLVQAHLPSERYAILRFSLLYSLGAGEGGTGFIERALQERRDITLFRDEWRTPLDVDDAASIILSVMKHRIAGTFHAAGSERISRSEMGIVLAQALLRDPCFITTATRKECGQDRLRPRDLSLNNQVLCKALGRIPEGFREVVLRKKHVLLEKRYYDES
jgi:dTDP-4-dehydrorhamnose reductase